MTSNEEAPGMASPAEDGNSDEVETGGVASIAFRVRCETLGHGEAVYLVKDDDPACLERVQLYTTSAMHPWYSTRSTMPISIPPKSSADGDEHIGSSEDHLFSYRFAVFRSGVFFRFEKPSDGPTDVESFHPSPFSAGDELGLDQGTSPRASKRSDLHHDLPLRLLNGGDTYTISNVLGITTRPPDIEKVKIKLSLHQQLSSLSISSSGFLSHGHKSNMSMKSNQSPNATPGRKNVSFAPSSAPFHSKGQRSNLQDQSSQVSLNNSDGLVVASVFLPVHLHRSDDGEWSADWDHEALLSMETPLRVTRIGTVKWRGWHGNKGADGSPESGVPFNEREKVEACLRNFNCVPVWCDTTQFGEMYNGFCKGVLWPIFHNVTGIYSASPEGLAESMHSLSPDSSSTSIGEGGEGGRSGSQPDSDTGMSDIAASAQFSDMTMDDVAAGPIHGDSGREAALWSVYTAINRQFADTIVQCFNEGDLVWIHGFHLLILPSLLTRRIPMAKIGLFTHTPFPSSEIFRTLWCREELLRGMLNADQVGFHLFEYARHFLTCCRRLLGLTYGMIPDLNGSHSLAIENNGRQVVVTSIHAGVEPPILNQFLCQTSTVEKTYEIRKQFAGKVIFCAIDKLESLKGIPLKLLGIERFLQRCPQWVGKIVLIQVGISAFEMGDDYMKTKNQVTSMAANINMRWPGTVQFQECSESEMRLPQRMTLLRAADVLMVTPLRDALNRIPLEFTMAHLDVLTEEGRNDGRQRGICILSEFSSTSRVMRGALHVNPWRISHIASAFQQALTMTQEERIRRATCASEFVTHVTTQRWALAVLLNLKAVQKDSNVGRSGVGLGLGYRILGMDSGYDTLDMNKVARSYKDSRSRLIILDYGGTILPNDNTDCFTRYQFVHKLRTPTVPDNRLLSILKELCSDNRNHVFVVSGKERHSLTSTLGDIPNLGLVSEHGMFVSWPAKKAGKRIWETTVPEQDKSWRSLAIMIMEVYSSRTHGSYIEETEMKVLWQYRDADPEFGYQQSRELEDHLSNVLREYAVDVLHGGVKEGGYVEVRPKGVNKGFASMHIIKNMAISNKIDFSLVIGDDHCDEPMLSVMRQIGRRAMEAKSFNDRTVLTPLPASVTPVDVSSTDPFVSSRLQTYTATVGKKPSASANYLNDVDDVHELLECLNRMSARDHQFYSSIDLTSMTYPIAGSGLSGVKKTGSVQFLSGSNSETITANVTRQVSLVSGFLSSEGVNPAKVEKQTSNTLADYLNTVEDDDDDDMFF